ncbi:hypothetical protein AB0F13_10380 [Streptomyces sp. NPDC026206]|uniref:hypothetical protein n=1 Tax=Streptomyces sp. NPDC026206 TaxID=3157089 RepID=UPI0033D2B759
MDVEVVEILDAENNVVYFESPAGSSAAVWRGTQEPRPGTYAVELEIPDAVQSWSLRSSPEERIVGVEEAGSTKASVTGVVERVDDDSVLVLRLKSDVLLVEMSEGAPKVAPGDCLTFTVSGLELYPYQL